MKIEISNYCKECLKFRQKNCVGKSKNQKVATFFGSQTAKNPPSFLKFCSQYEFDVRLYTFADGSGEVQGLKQAKQRQAVQDKATSDQEAMDDFDMAASLSSADFE